METTTTNGEAIMPTIEELAIEAFGAFETAQREDESSYVRVKEGSPEWISDLVHDAHGDFLPDDWRYESIRSALEFIGDGGDVDEPHEWADQNVDTYTGDRLRWLASNLQRPSYCDEAAADFGANSYDIVHLIGLGQYEESVEVFRAVVDSLQSRVDELEAVES